MTITDALNLFLSIAFYVFLLTAVTIGAAWWMERRGRK